VFLPSLSIVVERFARQLAVLTGPSGRLGGEEGIGGCEMTHADELKRCDPLGVDELRKLALHRVASGQQPLADVVFASLAQLLERRRPPPALRQAVTAKTERVGACREPPIALVTLRRWETSGSDRPDLSQRDRLAGVEHQAIAAAPRDLPDMLCAVQQAHENTLTVAHGLQDAEHQAAGIA
jgi:hypothetical protein